MAEVYTISSKFVRGSREPKPMFIYGLICPIENNIFYIGKTNNPQTRLEEHLFTNDYLIELASHDTEYQLRLKILETVKGDDNPTVRETYWILKMLDKGIKLKNKAYPMRIVGEDFLLLIEICERYNWNPLLSNNNRVKWLPDYGDSNV